MLSVVMLSVIMLRVMEPFQPSLMFLQLVVFNLVQVPTRVKHL
jgi:hypothetical protein